MRTNPYHSEAGLSARNLLAAGAKTADSSRNNAALRNDNSFWVLRGFSSHTTMKPDAPRRPLHPHGKLNRFVAEDSRMHEAVAKLWPEIQWIEDNNLRNQVTETWLKALERSPLKPDDLNRIPFTLLVPNCPITFMEHKRCVVHIARQSAEAMQEFMGRALPIHMDTVIAGAILADVGKLLEYELGADGKSRQSERGEALRHPFTGVALALECGVPDAVCHIIAAHAAEGDLVKRTTEAYIVHHADFMAFLPFKNPKNIKLK
jgi:putative nucleotidyltransferase with HDIG domain